VVEAERAGPVAPEQRIELDVVRAGFHNVNADWNLKQIQQSRQKANWHKGFNSEASVSVLNRIYRFVKFVSLH
jgi:hypothetical protein